MTARPTAWRRRSSYLALLATLVAAGGDPAPPPRAGATGFVPLTKRAYAFVAEDERSSNGALFIGETAALAVDPGLTPDIARRFFEAAAERTDRPIRWIVLTHGHPDHAMGVLCLERQDAQLVSHPRTRRALAENAYRYRAFLGHPGEDASTPSALSECPIHLPGHVVSDRESFDLGNHTVEVFHPGPAHTQGDLVVWSPEERVLATGDLLMNTSCPSMGEGSALGWASALDRLEALAPRHVVPGHFAPGSIDVLRHFHAYLSDLIQRARASLKSGGNADGIARDLARSAFADLAQFPQYGATFADNAAAVMEELRRLPPPSGQARGFEVRAVLDVGKAPHQISFSADGARAYVAAAGSDQVAIVSTESLELIETRSVEGTPLGVVEVADRLPFPPAATADGRKAFVPDYDDGTVTVVDLWNERVLATVAVGPHPSGGSLIESRHLYAVAVRGEDKIAFINTASHEVVSELSAGIGEGPFSVVVSPDESLAFVNNTASHDVSVLALDAGPEPRVIARPAVGEIPITLAVHPSGTTLWVGCEGSHELYVLAIPDRAAPKPAPAAETAPPKRTEVLVLGMIHGGHRTSERWGLEQVRETIERIDPDVIFPEIPPDRWERAWHDYADRGVITEPRVKRFPEYTDVLLPLKVEMGFEVEPCAGWTQEMSDLRQTRIEAFGSDPALADRHAAYERADAAVTAELAAHPIVDDDPRVIHSQAYDERTRKELGPYDEYLNDVIGPGGWTHINEAHYALIDQAIARHRGQRILVTFGAGHKYWLLDQLRQRDDIALLDVTPYLP